MQISNKRIKAMENILHNIRPAYTQHTPSIHQTKKQGETAINLHTMSVPTRFLFFFILKP